MKESGTVNRWTELNRKEKPILIKQSFQFHRWSYLNIWRWSTFYKFNFYSFHNFVLFASMKRRLQCSFSEQACTSHLFSHQYHSQMQTRFILYEGLLKQAFLPYSWLYGNKIKNPRSNPFSQLIKLRWL